MGMTRRTVGVAVPGVSSRSQQPFGPLFQAVLLRALHLPAQRHEQEEAHHLVAHLQPQVPAGHSGRKSPSAEPPGNEQQQQQPRRRHLFLRALLS